MKTALQSHPTFENCDIWLREETVHNEDDRADITLFLYPEKVKPNPMPFVIDFRTYPINVVCKFSVDGRSNATTATDTVTVNKYSYSDDIKNALKENLVGTGLHPIKNVYHLDFVEEDLTFKSPDDRANERDHRIKLVFNYHTYESDWITDDSGAYLTTDSGERIETD
jgi:hypothetical protein